jgi:hypothetical protein
VKPDREPDYTNDDVRLFWFHEMVQWNTNERRLYKVVKVDGELAYMSPYLNQPRKYREESANIMRAYEEYLEELEKILTGNYE